MIGLRLFKTLEQHLDYLDEKQKRKVQCAYLFAHKAHQTQTRHSGEPYITHPVAVTCLLAMMQLDVDTLIAALLHDVIEDTNVSKQDITEHFGRQVAKLVDGVSKLTQIEVKSHIELKAKNLRKMLLATAEDIRVIIIKLSDRLHNMRTLGPCKPEKRRRVAMETLEIFAPIAKRLGMQKIAIELEELGFSTLYPRRYEILKQVIRRLHRKRQYSLKQLKQSIADHLKKSDLPAYEIVGREKHLYSIYKKMRDKKIPFSAVYDVYAFRIIIDDDDITNCYRALGLIHQLYKPIPGCFKDYIATPKNNGYQSLHTILFGPSTIPIEVQIRNKKFDYQANNGIAAHWLYKSDERLINLKQLLAQQWVQNLLEVHKNTKNSSEFIKNFKIKLFQNEIYVFTPKGEILELPKGATVIDFAYAIHTDIGHSCFTAKIERQFVPLYTALNNGQTIEIITSPKAQPNPAWLDFITTSKARHCIQQALKQQHYKESVSLGKRLLKQALRDVGIYAMSKIPSNQIARVLHASDVDTIDKLYEQIALGNQVAYFIAHKLAHQDKASPSEQQETLEPLTVRGAENMVIHFAHCCRPIPNDPIVGKMKIGAGFMIHHAECASIKFKPESVPSPKYIPVRWAENINKEFTALLKIEMNNKPGTLATLALAISQTESNIHDINFIRRSQEFCATLVEISTKNTACLEKTIDTIKRLRAVISVERKIDRG